MEIRFCDLCQESIPDGDFENGRAVKVDSRSVCSLCIAKRALAGNGAGRTWLALALALGAAGAATWLLSRPAAPEGVSPAVAQAIGDRAGETLALARADVAGVKRAVDALDQHVRPVLTQGAEEARKLEERDRRQHAEAQGRVDALDGRLGALERAQVEIHGWLKELQARAAQAAAGTSPARAPEPAAPEPAPGPAPEPAPAPAPAPTPTAPDPGVDEGTLQRWIDLLSDPNAGLAFSATLELGRLKDLRAATALIRTLKTYKDFYVRLGAADALKELQACDAVPALIEALEDKDDLVRTSADQALKAITRHEEPFAANFPRPELRKAARAWDKWWKENEDGVRTRLNQPKA